MEPLHDPTIPLLDIYIYMEKIKNSHSKHICIPMFTAALFTIVKTLLQPKCPSTEEWIKKA